MAGLLFELKQVYYSYLGKIPALSAVNLEIKEGSRVGIIGANGSGKSTLLLMLDALLFPDKGELTAFGVKLKENLFDDVDFTRDFRNKVGFVFQNPEAQLFCPTVKEDILFGPLQLGINKQEAARRLEEAVGVLGIQDLLERPPHRLSIGEKRKVAIAAVLMVNPAVLILDEPTAGLDPLTTRHILDLLIRENKAGKTIITATHDLHIIEEISDVVHVFSQEKTIIKSGPPDEILKDTELLKDNNLMHIHSHRHKDLAHIHPHQHLDHHL
jgi:cobalt/nickel transport system ATP-binding protein